MSFLRRWRRRSQPEPVLTWKQAASLGGMAARYSGFKVTVYKDGDKGWKWTLDRAEADRARARRWGKP